MFYYPAFLILIMTNTNATEIIPGIWVGDQISSKDQNFLKKFNITVVINCTTQLPHTFSDSDEFVYVRLPVDDSLRKKDTIIMSKHLPFIVDFIKYHHNLKKNILIHCHAGMQRSAAVCAAYLHKHYKQPLITAIRHIINRRPIAFHRGNNVNFYDSFKTFEQHCFTYKNLIK